MRWAFPSPEGGMLLRLEPRGQRSRLWTYASPLLALALTVVTAAIIFAVLGKDPLQSLYVYLISPLTSTTGLPEPFVKAAPLMLVGENGIESCRESEGRYVSVSRVGGSFKKKKK